MADIINWDNKFGVIEGGKKIIDGVGKDAEILTNKFGGKQSKSPMNINLIDPKFLNVWFGGEDNIYCVRDEVIGFIAEFMKTGEKRFIILAISKLSEMFYAPMDIYTPITEIAKVLQEGASKYRVNNWRLIPEEDHINHALIHYIVLKLGDIQDNHLGHCLCRLMMAYATEKSPDFKYDKYVPEECERIQG